MVPVVLIKVHLSPDQLHSWPFVLFQLSKQKNYNQRSKFNINSRAAVKVIYLQVAADGTFKNIEIDGRRHVTFIKSL